MEPEPQQPQARDGPRPSPEPEPSVPEALLRSVVAFFDPQRVILFGSRARGDDGGDSDYDLLVVVDDDVPRETLKLESGYHAALPFAGAADVIPCRASTFARRRKIVGTLCNTASHEGIVVYERR
ncbi:MAG: nucleotidyltransferase domain-containing protein [Rhodospirillales bacterium]|nr:nucleotidyltransferase domain-containing protein [Rhodospirillales bacterium]